MVAARIGPYTVERELGAGGMGTVFLARTRSGRPLAVKVAREELAADASFRARFRAEIDAARRVNGFHTAPVVDADPDGSPPWMATAYVPGPTLAALLAGQGPMGEAELRSLGAALAEAIQAIHACGIVHRDLKPANIIMAEDGPRVLDFGIARAVENTRLTATGYAFGTPGFLAPEQALGDDVTGAADVFALGAILVAAAGGRAFGEGTPMGLMYRSVHEPADVSTVPAGLRDVVAACLLKEPAARPVPDALLDLFVPDGAAPPEPPTPQDARPPAPAPVRVPPRPATPPGGFADAPPPGAPAPFFGAADRRNSVAVGENGVTLKVGEAQADFGWDEIGAVVSTAVGFGKGLRVELRLYESQEPFVCEIKAPSRGVRDDWMAGLDLVLGYYLDK